MAKFKVGDRFKLTGDIHTLIAGATLSLIKLEGDGYHKYQDIETMETAFVDEGRLEKLSAPPRIEYTLPYHDKGIQVTSNNVHEIIKSAVCNSNFKGGCRGKRKVAGCNTCVFGNEEEGGTKDAFYQMVLDMVENDNG